MNRTFVALAVSALIAPPTAYAQKKSTAQKAEKRQEKQSLHDMFSGQGYGVAGCGLGSIAFGPKPGMIQVIAATVNGTFGSQTFGITSGTSNCDIPESGQQAAAFIEVNREILVKEAARGQGETVSGLAYILNCSDPQSFGEGLRANFGKIFADGHGSYQVTREILSTIDNDQALKSTCQSHG